jgi:hypothetical protein
VTIPEMSDKNIPAILLIFLAQKLEIKKGYLGYNLKLNKLSYYLIFIFLFLFTLPP